jgi:hypothetical protein
MGAVNLGPSLDKVNLRLNLDAANINSYSPNVIPYPTDIFAWCGSASTSNCTISRDPSITRQYGSIPLKMVVTGNDPFISSYNAAQWNLSSAATGQAWTVSVYVKATQATTGQLFIFGANVGNDVFTYNNYGAGTVNIGTSWTRVSFSFTFSNVNITQIQIRLDGPESGGSGITIWWDGLQVEKASSATTFNPRYFGNTKWCDISGNNLIGTLNAAQAFDPQKRGCIDFNGSSGSVQIPHSSLLNFTEITYLTFAKTPSTYTSSYRAIVGKQGADRDFNFYLYSSTSNGVIDSYHLSTARVTGYNSTATMPGASLSLNTWHQMGFSIGQGNINYILNGKIISTSTYSGTFNANSSYPLTIGSADNYFLGKIATSCIYNKILTANQILTHYELFKTRFL